MLANKILLVATLGDEKRLWLDGLDWMVGGRRHAAEE